MAAPRPSQLELSPVASSDTVFGPGFSSPWQRQENQASVPWETVQELLLMARDALLAKQRAAEALLQEVDLAKKATSDDKLLQRAQRAEVDSGLLLEELQSLIQAKADVAQQRADLDRANAMLMAERELMCEQLDVSPNNVNLCQAVQKVLGAARRARGLEAQLRLLARCQRELLLQLEATREEGARAGRHWQACEQAYLKCLADHGIAKPQLPPLPTAPQHSMCGSSVAGDGQCSSSSGGGSSSSNAAPYAQLLQRLGSGCNAAASSAAAVPACFDGLVGSPGSHMLPPTPPASDLNVSGGPLHLSRSLTRSHSLDSGLNSLTGLLDQLALGQLGSDEGGEYDYEDFERDSESWMLVDTMSDEPQGQQSDMQQQSLRGSGGGGASSGGGGGSTAAAAAALLMLGGTGWEVPKQQQQHLQPVQEGREEQEGPDVQVNGIVAC